jgi:16S rRNA U1498 N3-methylase RsmE
MLRDLSTLGIEQLVVVRTELGEKSYLESKLWRGHDVRRLLVEGAEQAGSTLLPRVGKAWRLADAIAQVVEGREGAPRVVFDNAATGEAAAGCGGSAASGTAAGGAGPDAAASAEVQIPAGARVAADPGRIIAVGSERGWTDGELHVLRDNGFETARLGVRILRTETAAIAAVTVTLRELGIV